VHPRSLVDAGAASLGRAMKLLGDWNWYVPKWLEWLPRLETDSTPQRGRHVNQGFG